MRDKNKMQEVFDFINRFNEENGSPPRYAKSARSLALRAPQPYTIISTRCAIKVIYPKPPESAAPFPLRIPTAYAFR